VELDEETCRGLSRWATRVGAAAAARALDGLAGVEDAELVAAFLVNKYAPEPRPVGLSAVQEAELMDLDAQGTPDAKGNPPSWVDDEAAWDRAKEAVRPKWDSYDQPYAVVAHVYQQMTGK
jgi:hypothetical protein